MFCVLVFYFFFFFQAEDGIRDGRVTGVQTCALPISAALVYCRASDQKPPHGKPRTSVWRAFRPCAHRPLTRFPQRLSQPSETTALQIGRASCRERVEISVVDETLKKKKGKEDT